MGTIGSSLQNIVRGIITAKSVGTAVTLYPFTGASVTTSDEGDQTITYGTGSTVYVVVGENNKYLRSFDKQGNEMHGDLILIFKDNQTIGIKDKITLNSTDYIIDDIRIITVTSLVVYQKASLHKFDGYSV